MLVQACPYFKLDCNAGGSLIWGSSAEQAVLHEHSQGQVRATVRSAPEISVAQSNGRSSSLDNSAASTQAAQLHCHSDSQEAHAVQAGSVCPDPLIKHCCLLKAAQATQVSNLIAQGKAVLFPVSFLY